MVAEVEIKFPQWNGKKRCVGIADFRMNASMIKVTIAYKRKDGTKSYPNPFYILREDAIKYPIMVLSSGVRVHMIPIDDMWLTEECARKRSEIIA